MTPPVITAVLTPGRNAVFRNCTCFLAQRASPPQATKKTPTAKVIPLRHISAPGATLIAERPSSPSMLMPEQVAALEKATGRRYRTLKRSGNLVTVTAEQLRKMID